MAEEKQKKMCFVIMGFGKKKDPVTNRTIDLNETYKKIIRPAVEACNYQCVRADEISDSGIIDCSMYALLYSAELVIADISTHNPNAIYELGTRHTLKPYSTIIIREDECSLPFDFNHNRILSYKHLGNEILIAEATKSVRELKNIINSISDNLIIDSPLYSFIPKIKRPILDDEDLKEIIGEFKSKEDSIYALMEKSKELKMQGRFSEAAAKWKQLGEKVTDNIYFIQQEALCTYKSEFPNKINALTNALKIIEKISNQTDTETLGISGAINKRLWRVTNEQSYLDTAIEFYKSGWTLHKDYYTGENYAQCLEQKSANEADSRRKIYYQVAAEETRQQIIEIIIPTLKDAEPEELKWKYATLANCYLMLDKTDLQNEAESKFKEQNPAEWELKTYNDSKEQIINLKN
jgi:hypothetical protein